MKTKQPDDKNKSNVIRLPGVGFEQNAKAIRSNFTSIDDPTVVVSEQGSKGGTAKQTLRNESGRLLQNRFELQEKIGSGGMGDVYKALDRRLQEAHLDPYVAIKLLNRKFARHKDAFIALQREASKTRVIASENIIKVYDFDRDDEIFFMGMEFLEGESLDEYLKHHPEGTSYKEALRIIDGFCQGLIDAHSQNTIHSDLKPGNIFYTTDQVVKVLDFGLAKAIQKPGTSKKGRDNTIFDPGSLGALTPVYAKYEMLTGDLPSKSDDVFAAALVAYELFTGKHPFARKPADEAFRLALKPKPIRVLDRGQWRAIQMALELRKADRTDTIEEFRSSLLSESLSSEIWKFIGKIFGTD